MHVHQEIASDIEKVIDLFSTKNRILSFTKTQCAPSSFFQGWGGSIEPPTRFSKRGGLTGPQLLEVNCLKRGGDNIHYARTLSVKMLIQCKPLFYSSSYFALLMKIYAISIQFFLAIVRVINVQNIFPILMHVTLEFPLKVLWNACLYKENLVI